MRSFAAARARLREQTGFSLVELVITCVVMGIVMAGTTNIFISGERASADGQARMTSQQNVRTAFDRIEFDTRCAQTAGLLSSGAGVHLTLPTWCDHATGNVTWCVNSGSLIRNAGTTCADTTKKITYITSVTSATPFSCYSPVSGSTPQLKVVLTVNTTTRNPNKTTATDYITMRNANSSGCA